MINSTVCDMPEKGIVPDRLRCEYKADPLGIDVSAPRLSWIVQSQQRGQKQHAYHVLVASSTGLMAENKGDLWDSGKLVSDETACVVYGGKALGSHDACFWKVMVWDAADVPSTWSETAYWTMGVLTGADWKAKWIGYNTRETDYFKQSSSEPICFVRDCRWVWHRERLTDKKARPGDCFFRRRFELDSSKGIRRARLYAAWDDEGKVYINGHNVEGVINNCCVSDVDVTETVHGGTNLIAVSVKNKGEEDNPAGLIGKLVIEYEDDTRCEVAVDSSWKVHPKKLDGWNTLDFEDSGWDSGCEFAAFDESPTKKITFILPPPAYLRSEVSLNRPIRRAVVYASSLGIYELRINGQKVGQDYFTPGWTDYDQRVYYNTYDVTDLVRQGDNAIGAIVADGWYSGYVAWRWQRDQYGDQPKFRCQLHVEYADGGSEELGTDESWRGSIGPIREADFQMGQTYDARAELAGWDRAGYDAAGWQGVNVVETIDAQVQATPGVTVQAFRELRPTSLAEPRKGLYVFDMGSNFAGVVRLKVRGEAGQRIMLRFAERLNPDGTIYTNNLRNARAIDTYICKGGGEEIWQGQFTFHGFQYVEVSGLSGKPGMDCVTGVELTSAAPVAGRFACSDETANILYRNICQTQRSNFIDIPTDCPQRDERLGWTGDAQIYIHTACLNNDTQAFYSKWLVDLMDSQRADGQFPCVAPLKVAPDDGGPAWAEAGVICPWTVYTIYGDKRRLEACYPSMVRFIKFCTGRSTWEMLPPEEFHCFGDWLNIKDDTPKAVIYQAYFAHSTLLTAKAARVLGREDDAKLYEGLYEVVKAAFNKTYVAEDGKIEGDSQTGYVLALAYDLLDEPRRSQAAEHLVHKIERVDWHLSTGFVGTKDLMLALAKIGRNDVAYRLFHNDTFPSWGFSVRHGATSIWERWDGWTPEKGFQDPHMNSFAHYSFGAVGQWMFENIGGIRTEGPGFKQIVIRPEPGGKLTWAKTGYDSIHGRIESDWEIKDEALVLDVAIPANTTATVYVPATDAGQVTESGNRIENVQGVSLEKMEDGCAVFCVGSGSYRFVSKGYRP